MAYHPREFTRPSVLTAQQSGHGRGVAASSVRVLAYPTLTVCNGNDSDCHILKSPKLKYHDADVTVINLFVLVAL